jgi:hypothetical protein
VLRVIADSLGKLWASPITLLGLVYGLSAHVASVMLGVQSSIRFGNNAIQFINCPGVLKSRAITLGNVILYGSDAEPWRYGAYGDVSVNLGRHEQAHTYQYQLLGPLFVLVYCLCGAATPDKNPLERAAQNFGARRGNWWC